MPRVTGIIASLAVFGSLICCAPVLAQPERAVPNGVRAG